MTLIVEDGTGLAGAESYVSVVDASTYYDEHGGPTANWTAATTAQKESALRYATTWLEARYLWPGAVSTYTQKRAWPRRFAYDTEGRLLTGVPEAVIEAQCEAAREHMTLPLNSAVSAANYLSSVNTSRSDGGESESIAVSYRQDAPTRRQFDYIDFLLALIARAGTGSSYLERA